MRDPEEDRPRTRVQRHRFRRRTGAPFLAALIVILLSGAINGIAWGQCISQKILASDGAEADYLSTSLAICGNVVVLGAPQDDDLGQTSGSAYVFRWDGLSWLEEAKLLAYDGATYDFFGYSVGVSGDAVIVGSASDDDNGDSSGSAYIFRYDGSTWAHEAKLLASDGAPYDWYGRSSAIDGDIAIVGSPQDDDHGEESGSAYVYRHDGSTWIEDAKLAPEDGEPLDLFGWSIAIEGDLALIGAPFDLWTSEGTSGCAYLYRYDGSTWQQEQKLRPGDGATDDRFAYSVAVQGDVALIGSLLDDDNGINSGSAYVYRRDGSAWVEETKLLASDGAAGDFFGSSVALSGDVAIIGAYGDDDNGSAAGSAYIFRFDGSSWTEERKLLAPGGVSSDNFGMRAATDGDSAVIAAKGDDTNAPGAGAAYMLDMNGPDCNANSVCDDLDILNGPSSDCNANGIPDECEIPPPCPWDIDGDCVITVTDLLTLLGHWGPCPPIIWCKGDLDGNGVVDVLDLLLLLAHWGPCPG